MIDNLQRTKAIFICGLTAILITLSGPVVKGNSNDTPPSTLDLPLVQQAAVPQTGTFYLLSTLDTNGFAPPFPFAPFDGLGLDERV